MNEQDRLNEPHARNIDSLRPEERDQLLAVPGWRIWTLSIHSAFNREYWRSLQEVEQNPNVLVITPRHRGHDRIDEKLYGVRMPFKINAFDVPDYVLEPLDQETVAKIVEQGENLQRLIKPEEFKEIL